MFVGDWCVTCIYFNNCLYIRILIIEDFFNCESQFHTQINDVYFAW